MKKNFITIDKAFEKELQKELLSIDQKVSTKTRSTSAMKGGKIEYLIQFIFSLFQITLSKLYLSIQWENQLKEFLQLQSTSGKRKQDLKIELATIKETVRKQILDNRDHDLSYLEHVFKRWNLIKIVIAFLTLGELAFNYKAFQVLAPNVFVGIILSLTLGVSLVFLAHFLASFIRKFAQTLWQHALYWTLSLGLMSLIFYFISHLRLLYISQMNDGSLEVGNWSFVCLNLIYFSTAMFLSYKNSPTRNQKKAYLQSKKDAETAWKNKNRISDIKKELKSIPNEVIEKEQLLNRLLVYLNEQEKLIQAKYNQKVQEVILNFSLQKGESVKTPSLPTLNLKYQSLNLNDYV
ncbi:MAG: hypothetical protein N4A45_05500 [Flavobacteriales bacterium]|jgi:hypothetical protein|nr:hypothetical protein [Flavobacteriales bacterium]